LQRPRVLVITPCGKRKHSEAKPAWQLCKSPRIRAVYNRRADCDMAILTAKYGLVKAEATIEPYKEVMTKENAKQLIPQIVETLRDYDHVVYFRGGSSKESFDCIQEACRTALVHLNWIGRRLMEDIDRLPEVIQLTRQQEFLRAHLRSKSEPSFLEELNDIRSMLSQACRIGHGLREEAWSKKHQQLYNILEEALSTFVDVTDWLHEALALCEEGHKKVDVELRKSWIVVAKQLIDILTELTFAYTTYENALGMGDGDLSISNLFLNADVKPYFSPEHISDSFGCAAEISVKSGEFQLAERYALVATIQAIWNSTDWEDARAGLAIIPREFERQKKFDESVKYTVRMLRWLYSFYSNWKEQYGADIYIIDLQSDLVFQWDKITDNAKRHVIEFWKDVINIRPCFYNQGFVLSTVIDALVGLDKYDEAFKLVEDRIALLARHSWARCDCIPSELPRNIGDLAKLGFHLKDRNIEPLLEVLDIFKSKFVEDKVSELADRMGYIEKEKKVWVFKNPVISKFMKDLRTTTVEVDVHQRLTEKRRGKERKVLFLAECKYTNKPATKKDIEFFTCKAKDLLEQEEEHKKFPDLLPPKLGELWFVSIHGFRKNVHELADTLKVDGCQVRLIGGKELNDKLEDCNLQKIPIVKTISRL
jgi:hypothetical protein